jgi:hypothetical protein
LAIIYPALHSKVPNLVMKVLKRSNSWEFDKISLLNVISGLTSREVLLKDERAAIILILAYFDKNYQQLNDNEKVELLLKVIKLNIQSRFGLSPYSEENILSSFLKDLEAGKLDIWESQIYRLI